jgi:hypothetical protein
MFGGAWSGACAFAVPTNPQPTSAAVANSDIPVFAINILPDMFLADATACRSDIGASERNAGTV